jgi:8-oxo-dGTP diphosphatase
VTRYCWRCAAALPGPPPVVCSACGEVHYANPKPCGEAVVVREGAVLLLRRATAPEIGMWDVPGGFCEADEHPMHAAERELTEELGLQGRAFACVGTWMDIYGRSGPDGVANHTATTAYLIELADPGARPVPAPEEASEARWFGLDALPDDLAFAAHARPMLAAAAELAELCARDARSGRPLRPLRDRTW